MNGNAEKFEVSFPEMMKPKYPSTLNNIFENLNAAKAVKYSLFLKEVEYIEEDIKAVVVPILRDGSFQKKNTQQ